MQSASGLKRESNESSFSLGLLLVKGYKTCLDDNVKILEGFLDYQL